MDKQSIKDFIRDIELLKHLKEEELDVLADYLDRKEYDKADLLFEQNGAPLFR